MPSLISHLPDILPLTLPTYCLLLSIWKWFPIFGCIQLLTDYYPTGKTSFSSPLNLPGRHAWITMELPSPIWLLVTSLSVSQHLSLSLPLRNRILIAIYLVHYSNRAIIGPLLNPTMSPMHILIWLIGVGFNFINPVLIGGWLGGYGKIDSSTPQFLLGIAIWAIGFIGNLYHEKLLREIRAHSNELGKKSDEDKSRAVNAKDSGYDASDVRIVDGRVYMIPRGGLFKYIWFPHYFFEWVEWAGYAIAAGSSCTPVILFLLNEMSSMIPRALAGKRWYKQKFGDKMPKNRKAAIPFLL
ncbi:3-oxo-5-alpha-steroid 4-dehydrogenase-like protein [Kalaharituber pfeilii]|nr:3-oxo-5-alpha-steroid 4-dehydrogenase-like protein [Kalaharituber pfeilii]